MKRNNIFKSASFGFLNMILAAGVFTACENAQVLHNRSSSPNKGGAVDSDDNNEIVESADDEKANDELFNLELHKNNVARRVNTSTKRRQPTKECPLPPSPELPVVSPESQGMTVGQTVDILVFVCSKTDDQFRALWTFGQSVTPEQLANLSKFEPAFGAQLLRLQGITKLVNIDFILGLKGFFCPNQSMSTPLNPTPATSTATPTATATATSTGTSTGTATGKVTVSGKESATIP